MSSESILVELIAVQQDCEIEAVARLAKTVWLEHYVPIIGRAQVDYMLAAFQSAQAIASQMLAGYEYCLAKEAHAYVGYASWVIDSPARCKLSQLYTLSSRRRRGVGLALLNAIEDRCCSVGVSTLWLTVNKYNHGSISWYKKRGFQIVRQEKTAIGHGYYMDDYVMAKTVGV